MVFTKAIIVLLDEILDNALLEIVNVSKASANKNQNAIAYLIDFEDTTSSLKISVLIKAVDAGKINPLLAILMKSSIKL